MMNSTHTDVGRRNAMARGASAAVALPLVLVAASQPAAAQSSATKPAFDPKNFPVAPPNKLSPGEKA